MKFVRNSSENEMVSEFLKAEFNSKRWKKEVSNISKVLHINLDITNNPDLKDKKENSLRIKILGKLRGYKQNNSLFHDFPTKVSWKIMLLSKRDLNRVKYINYDYWVELSGGTRLAKDGAESVKKGVMLFNESNQQFWELAKYIDNGGEFPKIIIINTGKKYTKLKLLEGHVRLTSYLLSDLCSKPLEAIVGFSTKVSSESNS